jgi:hypothetical protein
MATKKKEKVSQIKVAFSGDFQMIEQASFMSLLSPLVGRTIKGATVEKDDDGSGECWITLTLDDGAHVTALSDPEANGPGHLNVYRPEPTD